MPNAENPREGRHSDAGPFPEVVAPEQPSTSGGRMGNENARNLTGGPALREVVAPGEPRPGTSREGSARIRALGKRAIVSNSDVPIGAQDPNGLLQPLGREQHHTDHAVTTNQQGRKVPLSLPPELHIQKGMAFTLNATTLESDDGLTLQQEGSTGTTSEECHNSPEQNGSSNAKSLGDKFQDDVQADTSTKSSKQFKQEDQTQPSPGSDITPLEVRETKQPLPSCSGWPDTKTLAKEIREPHSSP